MTRGNYKGWGYSPLDQINTEQREDAGAGVELLDRREFWPQAPPIVNNGVMFVSTPYSQVIALDAETGDLLWRYKRELPEDSQRPAQHQPRRGAVRRQGLSGRRSMRMLVALDAKTGKVVWDKKVEDWKNGYYMTLAPLVVKGKVMVGVVGRRVRRARLRRRRSTPRPASRCGRPTRFRHPASPATTPGRSRHLEDRRRLGLDDRQLRPRSSTSIYWGTGNAAPWFGDQRPGDNLYTSSMVALDADTGKIKGHFQYHWNDSWDWDEMNAPMLVDLQKDGARSRAWCTRRATAICTGSSAAPTAGSASSTPGPTSRRTSSRASIPRPGRPEIQHGAQARHRQAGRVLPGALGRQGLAARGLQSRRPAWSTSRPTRTTAAPWKARSQELRGRAMVDRRRRPGHRLHRRTERRPLSASCRPGT